MDSRLGFGVYDTLRVGFKIYSKTRVHGLWTGLKSLRFLVKSLGFRVYG